MKLEDVLLNYYNSKMNLKNVISRNAEIDVLINNLTSKKITIKDIRSLLNILAASNYSKYSLKKVETTLIYMLRNNLFNEEYQALLDEFINYLNSLKQEVTSEEELLANLTKITLLINQIIEQEFITDLDLTFNILMDSNLAEDDIYTLVKEIDDYNKKISQTPLKNNESSDLVNLDLTSYEQELLAKFPKEDIERNQKYIASKEEFAFLRNANYHKLLVVLLIAPLENIQTILNLSSKYKIELATIPPTFYLNKDFLNVGNLEHPEEEDLKDKGKEKGKNAFYKNLEGNFENFGAALEFLASLDCNIPEFFKLYQSLFMQDVQMMKDNLKILKNYEITITNPLVLTVPNLIAKLDAYIEAGLYNYLQNYQTILLNKDKAFLPRIFYAKTNNFKIMRGKFLSSNITSVTGYDITEANYQEKVAIYSNKLVSDSPGDLELDESVLNNQLIQILDLNFLYEKNVYYIANTYVSRKKVIRLFNYYLSQAPANYFQSLLVAILKNLLLTKDTFDEIVLEVTKLYVDNLMMSSEQASSICQEFDVSEEKIAERFLSYGGK